MSWWDRNKKPAKYHGLMNQGATCYLNSVLQVLFMTEDFRETVKRYNATEHIDSELRELFTDLEERETYTYKITKRLKIKNVCEQRDAAEHYEKILRLTSSDASQIFHGKLENWNRCKECDVKTVSEAGFWNLPLPLVNSNNFYSVEKGIADFFSPSEITGDDQMYCEECDEKRDAVLHCEVSQQPEVLVLLLKRFEFDYRYMTYVKINQPVNVPYTVQIPQNQPYELYAFVEHFGELQYGHYISTIKSQDDNQWYIFDDSRVTQSKDLPALERSQSAYLLFYRKQKEAPLVNVSKGTEDSSRATEKEVGVQDENKFNVENKDTSVRAPLKRPFDKSKQEPEEVKKPKQELSAEGRALNQPGWKSPDNQDLDAGGCSSSQQMCFMENANQEHKVDNCRIDQTFSDHNVHSGISQERSENIDPLSQFSPNKDQWDRAGQSQCELFCTSDMRSSSSEALLNAVHDKGVSEDFSLRATCGIDLPNEQVLTMEVQVGQVERQESRRVNSYIGSVQNQINVSEAEEKKHCDGNGGCEGLPFSPDVDMEGDLVARKRCGSQEKVPLLRMERCCEEEAARTIENDSVKRFQSQMSDSHQICTSDCKVDHCIIDIEGSGSSMISQESGESESKVFCREDLKSTTSETVLNAADSEGGGGMEFNLTANYRPGRRDEHSLTLEVQSDDEGRQVNYIDDTLQNHGDIDKNSCVDSDGCGGQSSCTDIGKEINNFPLERGYEKEVTRTIKDNSNEKFQRGDLDASGSSLGQQTRSFEERNVNFAQRFEINTEDRESSEPKMPTTMCRSNNDECVKIEDDVAINLECEITVSHHDHSKDQPDIIKGLEPTEDHRDCKETTEETKLDNKDSSNEDELDTSGVIGESSCSYGICSDKCICISSSSQSEDLRESNDGLTVTKRDRENVSSDHANSEGAFKEPKPCPSVFENRIDVAQSPIVMQEDLNMDTGQLERTERSNFGENRVSVEGQERTAVRRDVKWEGSGNEVKRKRLLTKYDLYLETRNSPKFDSNQSQSKRWVSEVYKIVNQKEPETKCQSIITEYHHSAAKSEVEESEARFVQRRSVDTSRSDKDSEQREMADPLEGHSKQTVRPVFQSSVVTTVGDTETITLVLNKRQSRKGEGQVRREGCDVMRSLQHNRNAESTTDNLAKGVVSLTLSKEEDAGLETEAGERSRKDVHIKAKK